MQIALFYVKMLIEWGVWYEKYFTFFMAFFFVGLY